MGITYIVLLPNGKDPDLVHVTFSERVVETEIKVIHISNFDRGSVTREIFQVLRELKDSGLVREISWNPNDGLKMYVHRGKRRGWLINRLESILGPIAVPSRQAQSADR